MFCRLWNKFCAAPICTSANSIYARILAALRRFVEKLGGIAANSLIYRICLAVWRPIERVAGGGLIGRACRFVGMRGLLLICLAMYLPLDSAVRWVSDAGYLPSFVASVWDECLMLAAFAYILWHMAMKRAPLARVLRRWTHICCCSSRSAFS